MDKLKAVECAGYTHIETEGGRGIAYDMLAEDARRVVACVNACDGIGTEHLEKYGFAQKISDLVQQRDQLLEALEYAIKQVPEFATVPGIAAAIAAVKEE